MRFSWDERKRRLNLKDHGLDFVDAPRVFEGPTFTFEDDRFAYDKATKNEETILFKNLQD